MFEESLETTVPVKAQAKRSSKRWMVAAFFLALNAVIFLAAGTYWLNRGKPAGRSRADLDVAPPARQNSAPPSNGRSFPPKPAILQESSNNPIVEAAEPAPPSDQKYVQAKNKLKSAWHWMEEKNPELAKKFARQAIELAPDSDVAKEAQTLLDSLE